LLSRQKVGKNFTTFAAEKQYVMATLLYRISAKSDKTTGKCEILVRFFHGNVDQRAKTNIFVPKESWDAKAQRCRIPKIRVMSQENKSEVESLVAINKKLEALSLFIHQSFIDAGIGKIKIPDSWLAGLITNYNFPATLEEQKKEEPDDSEEFFEVFKHFIDTRRSSESRKKHLMVDLRALKRFSIYRGEKVTFENLTSDTLRDFEQYLINEHTYYKIEGKNWRDKKVIYLDKKFAKAYNEVPECRLPVERGGNAISKIMVELRTFIIWAKDDYIKTDPFKNYEIGQCLYGTPFYLNLEERNHLYHFDFSGNPRLETQRDIFIFQCVVGCRVSDLKSLKKSSIIDGAVEYIPRKTKEGKPYIVRVPLNAIACQILEKYKYTPGDALLPCYKYDRFYNEDIKEMCFLAGLDRTVTILNPTTREEEKHPIYEVASSHMARRCFIGNLYKQVKDPNLVGKLSGHAEGSKAFARYRDIDEEMQKELVKMLE